MTSPIPSTTAGAAQRINLRRVKLSHCDRRRALLIRRRFEQAVSAQALVGRRQAVRQRFLVPSSLVRIQAPQPGFLLHIADIGPAHAEARDSGLSSRLTKRCKLSGTISPAGGNELQSLMCSKCCPPSADRRPYLYDLSLFILRRAWCGFHRLTSMAAPLSNNERGVRSNQAARGTPGRFLCRNNVSSFQCLLPLSLL